MYRLNLRLISPDNEDNPLSFRCPSPLDLKACSSEMEPSNWFLLVRNLASFWGLKKINSSLRGKPWSGFLSLALETLLIKEKERRERENRKKKGIIIFYYFSYQS